MAGETVVSMMRKALLVLATMSMVAACTGGGDSAEPAPVVEEASAEPGFVSVALPTQSLDPVLTFTMGEEVRIPASIASDQNLPILHGDVEMTPLLDTESLTGHPISNLRDPLQDLELALAGLLMAAEEAGDQPITDSAAAQEAMDILLGQTEGRLYDGFPLLNYNQGGPLEDQIDGEYKMKELTPTGEYFTSQIDGETRQVWELTVNMLWYGQNFDSDTFLVRVPFEAHPYDEFRINWRVYSLIQEDLSPTTILNDGFGRIFHGLDSSFASLPAETLSEVTISYPSLAHFRGMYVWGWGVHPPRVQFLQPVVEVSAEGDLHPHGESFATRTRVDLTIDAISDVAPEMKAYTVASAAIEGATGAEIAAMLIDPAVGPAGTFREWLRLASDLRVLPPEAWDVLAEEDGLEEGEFGEYDIVVAYLNNEIYGSSPYSQQDSEGKGGVVKDWAQGDDMIVKVINLDDHTHYYRNVDFGAQLSEGMADTFGNGRFSFEKFSPKPSYGVPKVAEMQWRTGWGYVPHEGILQQEGLFPRPEDQETIVAFTDQFGEQKWGYVFENTSGYWRFNPPDAIREGDRVEAGDPLRELDGEDGVVLGLDTEGFGVAKMPEAPITTHPDQENFAELTFPGFLRNPNPEGGDIIPPTPVWSPFLALNPETGTLKAPDGSYWTDQTYLHGRPIQPGEAFTATIEAPRAAGQLFYQFDPLFHDNMIFSLHPRSDIVR